MMFVVVKLFRDSIDIPGMSIECVKLFKRESDAINFIENDLEQEKRYFKKQDVECHPYDCGFASIEVKQHRINMLEWQLTKEEVQ